MRFTLTVPMNAFFRIEEMTFLPSGLMAVLFHFVFYFVIPFGPFMDCLLLSSIYLESCHVEYDYLFICIAFCAYLLLLRFLFCIYRFTTQGVLSSSSDTRNQVGFKALKKKLIVLISLRWFICLLVIWLGYLLYF